MKSVLIAGLGTFGKYAARKMMELDNEVMVVDIDELPSARFVAETAPGCTPGLLGIPGESPDGARIESVPKLTAFEQFENGGLVEDIVAGSFRIVVRRPAYRNADALVRHCGENVVSLDGIAFLDSENVGILMLEHGEGAHGAHIPAPSFRHAQIAPFHIK